MNQNNITVAFASPHIFLIPDSGSGKQKISSITTVYVTAEGGF